LKEAIEMYGLVGAARDPGDITPAPDLSRVPGFGAVDVGTNIAGRLSDAQFVAVRNHALGLGTGAAFLSAFTFLVWMRGGISLFVGINGVCIAVLIYRAARTAHDLINPQIAVLEGDVRTEQDEGQCTLHIDGHKLGLSGTAYRAIPCGGPYRIYFLQRANLVVGAEVLPGWRPAAPSAARKRFPFSIEIG
jgi:hypothetical protein